MYELKKEIELILDTELKGFIIKINLDNSYGLPIREYMDFINIKISYENNFHFISFSLREDLLLFMNEGGNIWRKSDPTDKNECYEISHTKIPFRTPKKDKKAVLKAIKSICQKYKLILKDIAGRGLLLSEDSITLELINNC